MVVDLHLADQAVEVVAHLPPGLLEHYQHQTQRPVAMELLLAFQALLLLILAVVALELIILPLSQTAALVVLVAAVLAQTTAMWLAQMELQTQAAVAVAAHLI